MNKLQYKNFLLRDVLNVENKDGGYMSLVLLITDDAGVPLDVTRQTFFLKDVSQAAASMRIWLKALEPETATPLPKRDFLVYVDGVPADEADAAIIKLALARFKALVGAKFKGTIETVEGVAPTFRTFENVLPYVKKSAEETKSAEPDLEINALGAPAVSTAEPVPPAGNAAAFEGVDTPVQPEDESEIKSLV